jgi:hypothetical protein
MKQHLIKLFPTVLITIFVISGFNTAHSAEQDIDNKHHLSCVADNIQIQYEITQKSQSSTTHDHDEHQQDNNRTTKRITLVRQGNTVGHIHSEHQIMQSWYLTPQKKIKPTRYFDAHQRAIEYQPGELIHGQSDQDWSLRYQLISNNLLEQLTVKATGGDGCSSWQSLEDNTGSFSLTWLPQQRIVQSLSQHKGNIIETWEIKNKSHDNEAIKAIYAQREAYQATDFADIGDDHTDPFLTKMVTLGFIEAGASGFYDAQGNPLSSGHHH